MDLAPYVFVEPLVVGRVVLELAPAHEAGPRRLERAGAAQVIVAADALGAASLPDQSVDVVLCLAPPAMGRLELVETLLDEVARLLRPDGFAVLRLQCGDLGESGSDGSLVQGPLARRLELRFPAREQVSERAFAAVAFSAPGLEEMAVNEELARAGGEGEHLLLFLARGEPLPWKLDESLLVPLPGPAARSDDHESSSPKAASEGRSQIAAAEARAREAALERDALREALMAMQDQLDRRDETLATLRREAERLLAGSSSASASLELMVLERDRAERRASAAEHELTEALARLRRRDVELQGLERELGRLRAKLS